MRRNLKLIIITALFCAGAGAVLSAAAFVYLERWAQSPQRVPANTEVKVTRGVRLSGLASTLEHARVVDSGLRFEAYVRMHGLFRRFQAGVYRFQDETAPIAVIQAMSEGKIYIPIVAEFTIPEGFTMFQVRDRLVANGIGTVEGINNLLRDASFIKGLGIDSRSLEGFLYPATYQFFSTMPTAKEALKRMTDEFFKRLPADYVAQAREKGLSLSQAVVFASLIERETLHDDERPLVSEVIWRRLKDGSPLGIDAALIYGIEGYDGDIRWRDIKNAKNLYNTRIHKGLPPTAIGAPSLSSLLAVLQPADKRYYYYVRIPGSDNRHQFSRTLDEHNRYVQKWIKGN